MFVETCVGLWRIVYLRVKKIVHRYDSLIRMLTDSYFTTDSMLAQTGRLYRNAASRPSEECE